MTEPTHEYFDQIDADLHDVVRAVVVLWEANQADAAVDALRLTIAAAWWDGGQAIVQGLMRGESSVPHNPYYDERRPAGNAGRPDWLPDFDAL